MIEKIIFIIVIIIGIIIKSFFTSVGEDVWKYCKKIFKNIKDYFILFIKIKKIYNDNYNDNEYKQLKEHNKKYKDQAQRYNIFYKDECRKYYINQIKEKYGEELCTDEILRKYWLDDENNWRTTIKYNGNIYEIDSIGPDTHSKNIWQSFGQLNIYD